MPLDRARPLAPQLDDAVARRMISEADAGAVLLAWRPPRRRTRSWITPPWTGRRASRTVRSGG